MVGTEFRQSFKGHFTLEVELHIRQLGYLEQAPIAHPAPGGKAGKPAFQRHAAARFASGIGECYLVAARSKGAGRLKSCRACTNNEDVLCTSGGADAFGVPAAPPFLA